MKKLYLILFLLIPVMVFAGTLSGTHSEDGTPVESYVVHAFSFGTVGDYDISNAVFVFGTTTNGSGEWSDTTTLTTKHLVTITDPDDVKKSIQFFETPTE